MHIKARIKSCKGLFCLAEEDHGHGTQDMLEAGGWAKPAAQVCHHVQGSVGCRKTRELWDLGWHWGMTESNQRAVGLCRSPGGVHFLGSGDLNDYNAAQSEIRGWRKTLLLIQKKSSSCGIRLLLTSTCKSIKTLETSQLMLHKHTLDLHHSSGWQTAKAFKTL